MIPPHKYKRQHLNVPDILALCLRLKRDARADIPACKFLFGGKAYARYYTVKLVIELISAVDAHPRSDRLGR